MSPTQTATTVLPRAVVGSHLFFDREGRQCTSAQFIAALLKAAPEPVDMPQLWEGDQA